MNSYKKFTHDDFVALLKNHIEQMAIRGINPQNTKKLSTKLWDVIAEISNEYPINVGETLMTFYTMALGIETECAAEERKKIQHES